MVRRKGRTFTSTCNTRLVLQLADYSVFCQKLILYKLTRDPVKINPTMHISYIDLDKPDLWKPDAQPSKEHNGKTDASL